MDWDNTLGNMAHEKFGFESRESFLRAVFLSLTAFVRDRYGRQNAVEFRAFGLQALIDRDAETLRSIPCQVHPVGLPLPDATDHEIFAFARNALSFKERLAACVMCTSDGGLAYAVYVLKNEKVPVSVAHAQPIAQVLEQQADEVVSFTELLRSYPAANDDEVALSLLFDSLPQVLSEVLRAVCDAPFSVISKHVRAHLRSAGQDVSRKKVDAALKALRSVGVSFDRSYEPDELRAIASMALLNPS